MKDFRDKVVVITGAADGMGKAMALAFAREGAKLALADIESEGLSRTAAEAASLGTEVYSQVVDVSDPVQMKDFRDRVYERFRSVDVLVNNAGISVGGKMESIPLEEWERIIGINYKGVVYGCHFFYPLMVEQGSGHIINMSSYTGLAPASFATPYCSTKHAVQGFTESLRAEAALHGIGVTALCPGNVNTRFTERTAVYTGDEKRSLKSIVDEVARRDLSRYLLSPERVAEEAIEGIRKNRGIIRLGLDTWFLECAHRLSRRGFGLLAIAVARASSKDFERRADTQSGPSTKRRGRA